MTRRENSVIVSLRRAVVADGNRVFEWRNNESTRKFFFDPTPISKETHAAWYDGILSNENVYLLIGEVAGEPVGVLRYDVTGECAEVSVYLVPTFTGLGLGAKLLIEGTAWVRRNVAGLRQLKARIVVENLASLRAFEKAGFRCEICEFTCEV